MSAEAREALGRELLGKGELARAVTELNEAIRLNPNRATAYNARGYAYLRMRMYKNALADFDQAIRLDPKYANAYHNRAAARRASGNAAGAAQDLASERHYSTR